MGYATWVLYNLHYPLFLARDIEFGDPSWLIAAMNDFNFLAPRDIATPPLRLDIYTDATPHSIAAIAPALNRSMAQAFHQPEEINIAEMTAAIKGLIWVSQLVRDTYIHLYVDNSAVRHSLTSGKGITFRNKHLRKLFLSMLHNLNGNSFKVLQLPSEENPADRPSRLALRTLAQTPFNLNQLQQVGDRQFTL